MKQAVDLQPKGLICLCNYGSLLAEMGSIEEASEMLERAEHAYSTQITLGNAKERAFRKNALEELRGKLDEAKLRA
jgi:Tfp pilus assembly protein PilF